MFEMGNLTKELMEPFIAFVIRKLRSLAHVQPFLSLYYLDEFFLIIEYLLLCDLMGSHIILRLALTFALAGLDTFVSFCVIKPELLELDYTGRNMHLFSKNIATHDLALASVIALLVGIVPATSDYYGVPADNLNRFLCSTLLSWLTCVVGIQRGMLEHTRSVWIANKGRTKFHIVRKRNSRK